MKKHDDRLRSLLDDIMPDSEVSGAPQCAGVLAMVREEKTRRNRQRVRAGVAVAAVGLFAFTSFYAIPPEAVPLRAARLGVPKTAAPVVQRIDDAELLALLQDAGTPSALMEWPNGSRTLLIVEHKQRHPVQ